MIDPLPNDVPDRGFGVNQFRRFDLPEVKRARDPRPGGAAAGGGVAVLPFPGEGPWDGEARPAASARVVVPQFRNVPSDDAPPAPSPRVAGSPTFHSLLTVAPLLACDALSLMASALIALAGARGLHALGAPPFPTPNNLPWQWLFVLLPLVAAYGLRGLYPGVGLHPAVELRHVVELNTTACLCAAVSALTARSVPAPEAFFGIACVTSIAAVPLARALTRHLCARRGWWGLPAVVIGPGDAARETARALLARPGCGLWPCGMIDPADEDEGAAPGGAALPRVPYAVLALTGLGAERVRDVVDRYRGHFPRLLILSDAGGPPGLWRDTRDLGGGLVVTEARNRALFALPRFVKRAADAALTATALALGLPLLAAVALAVRTSSPGPVFFGHRRMGRNGRTFKAWKFRTMRTDADKVLRELLAGDPEARREWELDHKLRNDPRVTPIGNFLRKTSLDELPQLWNVLAGDMSLVGPRPIVSDEVRKYGEVYRLYSQVRPGITGLWQVSGRNNTTYEERVRLDAFYVRNWSPWLDAHILVRTVKTILGREGAY